MRYRKNEPISCNPDMTPMIDCTFQLVIFFLLTLNFSTDEQSELIRLPSSEVAKPAQGSLETSVVVQILVSKDKPPVLFGGDYMTPAEMKGHLLRERDVIRAVLRRKLTNATIVIRADRDVPSGLVQEVIRVCQEADFERFVLRAKWKEQ